MRYLGWALLGLFGGFTIVLTLLAVIRWATGGSELSGAWTVVPESAAILGAIALPLFVGWRRRVTAGSARSRTEPTKKS